MNHLMMQAYVKLLQAKQNFLEEERGAVDIVAIVVMIGIAVALALLFRTQIEGLLNTLFDSISKGATDAVKPG